MWKYKLIKHFNDSKDFIEYSNDLDVVYKNIEEYNPNKNAKYWFIWLYHYWYA